MHRLLLVDDDPVNLAVLEEIFSETDELCTATSGEEALQRARSFRPDLILLDVMMPQMDGFETCRRLKADPETAEIPVLFLTAGTELKRKLAGFACGGADYITKPFEAEEVVARTQIHLKLRDARQLIHRHSHELEQMLQERTRELIQTERHAAFSLLMQGIIHNLRGPLTAVMGLSDLMCTMLQDKADELLAGVRRVDPGELAAFLKNQAEQAELILGASDQLKGMIDSMMSKGRTAKEEHLQVVDLNELIRQELLFLEGDMRFKHQTEKRVRIYGQVLPVRVVPSDVAQVIGNLLRNALDATHHTEHPVLQIESGRQGTMIWFRVGDNGPGIPKELREKIFDPFFTTKPRAGQAVGDEPTGTGLGLYTVLATANAYGGKVAVGESDLGGARIECTLPLATTSTPAAGRPERTP